MNVETLLKSMTLEQKVAQFTAEGSPSYFVKGNKFDSQKAIENFPHGIGGMMVPIDLTPAEIGEWTKEMRECFKELSPVPPILMCESLHGILGKGTTVYPQSIGMGATFDPELMYKIGEAIGREAKTLGIRMSLAPDLDLGREPRWGRIEETYGESSFLTGRMGEAYVKGLLADDGKYAPVIKHFAAHGSPEAGVNLAPVNVNLQDLEDKYLPPFKKALDAGAKGVMPAYSTLNGIPCHTNPLLMNEILRKRWGFDGVVVSDFGAMDMLGYFQNYSENQTEIAKLALEYGIDFHIPPILPNDKWVELIYEGVINEEDIDKALRRILKMKIELGLFDIKEPDISTINSTVHSKSHINLAKEAALKSIVLLKNEDALPLKEGEKIAVIGPNAFSCQLGDYALPKQNLITPAEAIKERAEKCGGTVFTAKGCEVYGYDTQGFTEAENAASKADKIICIIGGKSMKGYGVGWGSEDESMLTCGEGCDMHDLTPGGPQLELVRKMIATGKPVVTIMIDGRPETLFEVFENTNALIAAWYPGEEGSIALSELLYGDANFAGKLPVTFPRHTGQVPIYHDRVPSASGYYHSPGTPEKPGQDYVFGGTTPAFEFGFGLGYSKLIYKDLTAKRSENGIDVKVTIENIGAFDADESVLIFIRDEIASIPQPVKKLAALGKAFIPAGTSKTVELHIDEDELKFTGIDMTKRLENGWFTLNAGNCSTRIYLES